MKNPAKLIFIASAMLLTIMTYVPARAQVSIVPQPQSVRLQRGSVSIPASPRVYVDKKARLPKGYLQGRFSDVGITATQVSKPAEADIAITLGKGSGQPEGYVIRTSAEGGPAVTAVADDRNGALYSIESILQLVKLYISYIYIIQLLCHSVEDNIQDRINQQNKEHGSRYNQ